MSYQRENWFWEFYPPPYNFMIGPRFPPRNAVGLGCAGDPTCSCSCSKGVGDAGTMISNLTSGNWSDALFGNDFFSGVPNVFVIVGGLWLLSKVTQDLGK